MSDDQGPSMEVRAFIAVVLSLGVMVGYQYFFAPTTPLPDPPAIIEEPFVELGGPTALEPADEPPTAADPDAAAEAIDPAEPALVTADGPEQVTLETDRYRMVLDNRGARITSVELVDFDADFDGPLELVVSEPGFAPVGMLSLTTPEQPEVADAANSALYRMTIDGFEPGASFRAERPAEIRWQWIDASGWSIDKQLTVTPDGYLSNLRVSVEAPVDTPTFLTLGPGLEMHADTSRTGIYLMSGVILFGGAATEHLTDADLDSMSGAVLFDGAVVERLADAAFETPGTRLSDLAWGGIQSSYFAALLVPEAPAAVYLSAVPAPEPADSEAATEEEGPPQGGSGTRAIFGLQLPRGVLVEAPLYLGPKDFNVLAAEGHGLERAVDYGLFGILARPVAVTLETLYDFTGNYGLAIILATFGVRLIFFPLSQSSMKSMRKMQQLQPQMNAIRGKYKGVKDTQKRQEMNAEVMQLYKDNGVSPLGGCLPMLLQMPVLFGFYAAISVSSVSRHAPFALWIQDLSKMDPYYVLPVAMGGAMFAQQRMSPGTGDPMQQRIFRLMPIMFTFFFLTFPSGLVIYWLVNTVLGIAQQGYVNRQLGAADAIATPGPRSKKKRGSKGGAAKRKKRGKR